MGLTSKLGLQPLESPSLVAERKGSLDIGILKSTSSEEKRVVLTPRNVEMLTADGYRVLVEIGAGKRAGFPDNLYAEAGAVITSDVKEIYKSHILLKICPLDERDADHAAQEQIIISPMQLSSFDTSLLDKLAKKKVTALAFEFFRSREGRSFPFVKAMSEIAGYASIFLASEALGQRNESGGKLFGGLNGVEPISVLILGAGVVGRFAARAARGFGATVMVMDNDINKLSKLQNHVGEQLFTNILDTQLIAKVLENTDVVIGALHSKTGRSPIVVSEHMVTNMKSGSVIIDVSIDQGGCIETSEITSHEQPFQSIHDVWHCGLTNIPSRFSKTASIAISHLLGPMLSRSMEYGGIHHLMQEDNGIARGVYMYRGQVTQSALARRFDLKATDLSILFTTTR